MYYVTKLASFSIAKRNGLLAPLLGLIILSSLTGCQTAARSGALSGAGVGALIGGLAGGSTTDALIGAGIGTGIGYLIGNEMDKNRARQLAAQPNYTPPPNPLAGTSWQVLTVNPMPEPAFRSMTLTFQHDGKISSTKILENGEILEETESYRVVEATLIVNRPGYLLNLTFIMSGDRLTLQGSNLSAVLKRVGS